MSTLFNCDHEEGDLTDYDATVTDSGDLSVSSGGLGGSSYKMEALLDDDTTAIYGQMNTVSATSDFRIGCRFDPNSAFSSGEFSGFMYTNATASPWHSMVISCHHDGSNHQIRLRVWEDDGTTNDTSLYTITDAEHTIEVHMVRATNSGSSDGTAALIIDGITKETLTGLDNYDIWALMDKVQFGGNIYMTSNLGAAIYLDDCTANDDGGALFAGDRLFSAVLTAVSTTPDTVVLLAGKTRFQKIAANTTDGIEIEIKTAGSPHTASISMANITSHGVDAGLLKNLEDQLGYDLEDEFHVYLNTDGSPAVAGYNQPSSDVWASRVRALWIQATAVDTSAKADAVLQRAVLGRFNTLLVLVGSGQVTYNSSLLPDTYNPSYDPLAYMIQEGHALGMDVEAWWCPGYCPNLSVFRSMYPDWDVYDIPGTGLHWLNFNLSAVQTFVGDVVCEIVNRYDVDAVHLDYIRFWSPPPYGPSDPASFFNSTDVPTAVETAYDALQLEDSTVRLTAAVYASIAASSLALQNWDDWLTGDYIDRIHPMAYFAPSELSTLQAKIADWDDLDNPTRIMPGLKITYDDGGKQWKTPAEIIDEIQECWSYGTVAFRDFVLFDETDITTTQLEGIR